MANLSKSICFLSRKAGSSREEFRAYYENAHAPLACTYFPFRKYVRNHVISATPATIDFDVITEFYMDRIDSGASVLDGPVGPIMQADEERFMDRAMLRWLVVRERLVAGAERGVEPAPMRRQIALVQRRGDAGAFDQALADLAGTAALSPGVIRVSLDTVTAVMASPPPVDAFLSTWLDADAPAPTLAPPPEAMLHALVMTEVCESAPEDMARAYTPVG